jgi:hypothetical protein
MKRLLAARANSVSRPVVWTVCRQLESPAHRRAAMQRCSHVQPAMVSSAQWRSTSSTLGVIGASAQPT